MMERMYGAIVKDHFHHNKQMAFVCGPRQVGKTTIAHMVQRDVSGSIYRTWDSPQDRVRMLALNYEVILEGAILSSATHSMIVFDEIHKYPNWKNYLKGFYDLYHGQLDILVTGSARLNIFQKFSDSLMGRYFLYRVHPLSLGETGHRDFTLFQLPKVVSEQEIVRLLNFGGFPEPFNKESERFCSQWQSLRQQQLIYEDIRSLEAIHNLSKLELLTTLLQYQVGQQCTYASLSKKIGVSIPTIQRWISVLEQVYYCFMIRPWTQNITRSLIKEPKVYLWDWSLCPDVGARYENFVASHLLKAVHFWTDNGLGVFDLYYIRTKDQKEVDFLVTKNAQPWMLIEVKASSKASISRSLYEYKKTLSCPFAFQIVFDLPSNERSQHWLYENVFSATEAPVTRLPAASFLSMLV